MISELMFLELVGHQHNEGSSLFDSSQLKGTSRKYLGGSLQNEENFQVSSQKKNSIVCNSSEVHTINVKMWLSRRVKTRRES